MAVLTINLFAFLRIIMQQRTYLNRAHIFIIYVTHLRNALDVFLVLKAFGCRFGQKRDIPMHANLKSLAKMIKERKRETKANEN